MGSPPGYRSESVVLRVTEFGETSQVVQLGTPEHGLVAAFVKGARRSRGDFEGGLALGVLGVADLSPRRGADLEALKGFRTTDALRGLRTDPDRYAAGCHVLSLLREWFRPALPAPGLFLAGVTALRALASAAPSAVPAWTLVFEARALAATGHRPHLETCVACRRAVEDGARFAPAQGGVVHGECAGDGPTRRLAPDDLAFLRRLYTERLPALVREPPTPTETRAARAVHDLFLPYVLERSPRSARFVPR